ncbi:MAG: TonB-dependent receptor, partial [Pseudomonadota bacterium]
RAVRADDYTNFTEELRFTSDYLFDSLDFIVGVYYENSDLARFQSSDINFVAAGLGPILLQRNEPWQQQTETIAAFGQVRYDVIDRLRLIVGGRFAHETKDFNFDRYYHEYGTDDSLSPTAPLGPFDPAVSASASRSEDKFTPAATLQYELNDDVNVYASYAQGHKTGGFSDRIDAAGVDFDFDAEDNTSYELGMKGIFFDGSLTANLTLYYMDVEGLQLATQVPGTIPAFSVNNAAEVTSKGVEFDAQFRPNDLWTIGIDYAYSDATYDEFVGTPDCPASAVNSSGECDLSGFPLIFAPKHSGNGFIEVFDDTAFGQWGAGARFNASFSDEYFTDIAYADSSFEDGYGIFGASIRLVSPDENYTISLVGKNLTEEVVLQWGIPSGPNSLASLRAPREIAVRFSAQF